MAEYDLGTARGRIEIDASGAEAGFAKGGAAAEGFKGKSEASSAAASASYVRTGTVLLGTSALIVAGFGLAVNASANFEERISAIAAVSGATGPELDKIRDKALQLGADTKYSAGEAATAMEELVKAGLTVPDVLNGAADATVNLAAAGEIDLPRAATISANAMNAFGLAAQDMPHIADLIAGAANASAIDVGQFGESLQQVGAVAHLVGFSFDDVSVAIAAMGNAGIVGSDAGTSLKAMMMNLQPQTAKAATLMEQLGIVTADGANQFFDANGKIKSMADVSSVLGNALQGMTEQQKLATLQTLFGSDAIRAAAVVADTGAQGFADLSTSMGKVTAADVAATRMDNLKGSIEQLKGSVETLMIRIGKPLADALKGVVDWLTQAVNWFTNLDQSTIETVIKIAGIVAAVLGAAGAFLVVAGTISKFTTAMSALSSGLLANPVVLIAAAIIALGVALIYAYNNIKPFHDFVDKVSKTFREQWLPVINQVADALGGWGNVLKILAGLFLLMFAPLVLVVGGLIYLYTQVDAFRTAVDLAIEVIGIIAEKMVWLAGEIISLLVAGFQWMQANVFPVVTAFGELIAAVVDRILVVWGLIWPFIKIAIDLIMAGVTIWVTAFQTLWDAFGEHIFNFISIIFDEIKTVVEDVLQIIRGIMEVLTGLISGDWGKAWDGIKDILSAVWDIIKSIPEAGLRWLLELIPTLIDGIKAFWDAGWNAIKDLLAAVWEAIKGVVQTAFGDVLGFIQNSIGDIVGWFGDLPGRILGALGDLAGLLVGVGRSIIGGLFGALQDAFNEVHDWFNGIGDKILNAIGDLGRVLWNAGRAVVEGFIGGIKDMFGSVASTLGDLKDKLTGWKGPPEEDAVVLTENGQLVIQGFLAGLKKEWGSVEGYLRSRTADLSATVGATIAYSGQAPRGGDGGLTLNLDLRGVSAADLPAIRSAVTDTDMLDELVRAARAGTR